MERVSRVNWVCKLFALIRTNECRFTAQKREIVGHNWHWAYSLLMDGYQLGRLFRLSSHVGYVRCRQRIFFCTLGSPCQLCCFCSDHVQPAMMLTPRNQWIFQRKRVENVPAHNRYNTYLDFIVFTDWHTAHIVLLSQFFGQWGWHQLSANVWWRREMPFAVFAAVGGNVLVEFHDWFCFCRAANFQIGNQF